MKTHKIHQLYLLVLKAGELVSPKTDDGKIITPTFIFDYSLVWNSWRCDWRSIVTVNQNGDWINTVWQVEVENPIVDQHRMMWKRYCCGWTCIFDWQLGNRSLRWDWAKLFSSHDHRPICELIEVCFYQKEKRATGKLRNVGNRYEQFNSS